MTPGAPDKGVPSRFSAEIFGGPSEFPILARNLHLVCLRRDRLTREPPRDTR